ncbi:MAG TPA: hypothetical protein DCE56_12400, partial [Cyanobacteria bacterium UBA8553]|nr:hypothetical protein [Cyanobacteria bacterium UBA8553]
MNITTDQFFRATGTFTDNQGAVASISSVGSSGGGAIRIQHGGNGVTPFIVGDATTNGTSGSINSGEARINPNSSFLYTHVESPNIAIVSVPDPTPTPSPTPLSKPIVLTCTLALRPQELEERPVAENNLSQD